MKPLIVTVVLAVLFSAALIAEEFWYGPRHYCFERSNVKEIVSVSGRSAKARLENGYVKTILQGHFEVGTNVCAYTRTRRFFEHTPDLNQ